MIKAVITGEHPETKEQTTHNVEADAICAISVTQKEGKIEVNTAIMGAMNGYHVESMVQALVGACSEILKEVDPFVAHMILAKAFSKEEEETDGMAGESSEPERPTEQ